MFDNIKATLLELKVVCSKTLQDKTFKKMYSEEDYNKVVKLFDELNNMKCSNDTIIELEEVPNGFIVKEVESNELPSEA